MTVVSELSPTQTGNAGPVDELTRKRLAAIERMARLNIKRLHERRGNSPEEKWADKRIEL